MAIVPDPANSAQRLVASSQNSLPHAAIPSPIQPLRAPTRFAYPPSPPSREEKLKMEKERNGKTKVIDVGVHIINVFLDFFKKIKIKAK